MIKPTSNCVFSTWFEKEKYIDDDEVEVNIFHINDFSSIEYAIYLIKSFADSNNQKVCFLLDNSNVNSENTSSQDLASNDTVLNCDLEFEEDEEEVEINPEIKHKVKICEEVFNTLPQKYLKNLQSRIFASESLMYLKSSSSEIIDFDFPCDAPDPHIYNSLVLLKYLKDSLGFTEVNSLADLNHSNNILIMHIEYFKPEILTRLEPQTRLVLLKLKCSNSEAPLPSAHKEFHFNTLFDYRGDSDLNFIFEYNLPDKSLFTISFSNILKREPGTPLKVILQDNKFEDIKDATLADRLFNNK